MYAQPCLKLIGCRPWQALIISSSLTASWVDRQWIYDALMTKRISSTCCCPMLDTIHLSLCNYPIATLNRQLGQYFSALHILNGLHPSSRRRASSCKRHSAKRHRTNEYPDIEIFGPSWSILRILVYILLCLGQQCIYTLGLTVDALLNS